MLNGRVAVGSPARSGLGSGTSGPLSSAQLTRKESADKRAQLPENPEPVLRIPRLDFFPIAS